MRYWLTTHWPKREREESDLGVWLAKGKEAAGKGLAIDDKVVIYEFKGGPTKIVTCADGFERRPCRKGREGVVLYGYVTGPFVADEHSIVEHYTNGKEIPWHWFAPLEPLSRSGFVSRSEIVAVLGVGSKSNLRGLGKLNSGLREISEEVYTNIVKGFHGSQPLDLQSHPVLRGKGQAGGKGESAAHEELKKYVANHPAEALGEEGLRTIKMEYAFPTGDRADIVLADSYERIIGVEVETEVGSIDVVGPLQAIKYRFMLEWLASRAPGDSRAILVAYTIAPEIKQLCRKYSVEFVEIPKRKVM